ncbi:hypothetical protein [Pandoraea terrigena]|uniref:hypothetical protein n=1 Tax=Pandoraea terrigena TaxID=2508292 RepID=UPI001583C9E2|nr:hypothetical protein [Pandoraea terrigena]
MHQPGGDSHTNRTPAPGASQHHVFARPAQLAKDQPGILMTAGPTSSNYILLHYLTNYGVGVLKLSLSSGLWPSSTVWECPCSGDSHSASRHGSLA